MTGTPLLPSPPSATAAGSTPGPRIDTLRVFETPEGVDLRLRLAGPVPRAMALAIDWLVRLGLYAVLTPLVAFSGLGVGLVLLGLFLVEWFYPVLFELHSGATPGKRAMGLTVVHNDGTPVGPAASLLRNLLRAVDFLPLFYAAGLVSMLLDTDFRRLGDLTAGTLVVYADDERAPRGIPRRDPKAPPTAGLPVELQQALVDFAERSPHLSGARCAELAELALQRLGSGTPPLRGKAAVEHLLGIANWIAGRR